MTFFIEYCDPYEGNVSYEVTASQLIRALAKCMIKHAGGLTTTENIKLFTKIIDDLDLICDDDILEYFEDELNEEFATNYKEYL